MPSGLVFDDNSTLTEGYLRSRGACVKQRELFASYAPDGVPLDNLREFCLTHAAEFDWEWAAENLLSDSSEYFTQVAPILAEYQAKRTAIWKEYQAKRTAIWEEYLAKRAAIRDEYEAKRAAIWAERFITENGEG